MIDLCIIGAGPAGLMAAIHAARNHAQATILEANPTAGRKLLITGGGRCNFTHAGSPDQIARAFEGPPAAKGAVRQERFLRHCLHEFSPDDAREFFRSRGLPETVEPDGCVFPAGNQAAEVRDVLVAEAVRLGAHIQYQAKAIDVAATEGGFAIQTQSRRIAASRLILATGGLSYPQTGSTGDGYRFAQQLGHAVIPPKAALVPLVVQEAWVRDLAGVALADVKIRTALDKRAVVVSGNMLFTQRGIGGPAAQDLSRYLTDALFETRRSIPIEIDVLAGLDELQADRHLQNQFQTQAKKTVSNVLSEFLPRQLALTLCLLAGCGRQTQAGQLPGEQRRQLVRTIKRLPLTVTGVESIAKATVTRGGVSLAQIDPRTMESKVRPGLFFAGEVIDLDGPCGGYNLQMCWSTGALAGRSAARPRTDGDAHV
ncbi:MAG: NAD(P)/FAD-dependent oxidoreductase [Planctomycetes bacterium]|nr:NAD(P)/FAD-dependent oxidoreductase [Planctomycetota bacterium]